MNKILPEDPSGRAAAETGISAKNNGTATNSGKLPGAGILIGLKGGKDADLQQKDIFQAEFSAIWIEVWKNKLEKFHPLAGQVS